MSGKAWRAVGRAVSTVVIAVAVPLTALVVAAPQAPRESPLVGTWVADLGRSTRDPNHQFQSAAMHFAVDGEAVTLTYEGVNAGGRQESNTVVLQADGKEHPVPGQVGVTVVTRWVSPRQLQTVAKSQGAPVGEQSYEVSSDGQTLTATVSGTDARGRRFQQVIVFDRR